MRPVLLAILVAVATPAAQDTDTVWTFNPNPNTYGHRKPDPTQTFTGFKVIGQCAEACFQDDLCVSFNFEDEGNVCELSYMSQEDAALQAVAGFEFWTRDDVVMPEVRHRNNDYFLTC